jgi:hypothetical protein
MHLGALEINGFSFLKSGDHINSEEEYWKEIGDIDKKGHEENQES